MTIDAFIRYGSLWTLILGVLSLTFAVRNYRRQVNAQIFFEIATRYHDMLRCFPVNEWITRLNHNDELPQPTSELTPAFFVTWRLCISRFCFTSCVTFPGIYGDFFRLNTGERLQLPYSFASGEH